MHPLRTRFKKEIVAEFLPPAAWFRKYKPKPGRTYTDDRAKVIIFCYGSPGVPSRRPLLQFLSRKGYWIFFPRYRGSWESDGKFLRVSPERDVLDVIDELPRGFTDVWSKTRYRIQPKAMCLYAGSFGGPAGILASRDPRVTKVLAAAPVVDWRALGKAEPFEKMYNFYKEGFGMGYRLAQKDWDKLSSGKFYSPVAHAKEIDGKKLFIIQAKDDESVAWRTVVAFE